MPDIPTAAGAARVLEAASRFQPWRTVRRHNRLILQEYEDLITWARDDIQEEGRQLSEVRASLAARGALRSGEFGHGLRRVRDTFAQRWRDRSRAAQRLLAEIRENEGLTVQVWRGLARKPWPENPNDAELRGLVAAWEDEGARREAVERELRGVGLGTE